MSSTAPPVAVHKLDSAEAVDALATWLFGSKRLTRGVVHPTACAVPGYRTLRIEPSTPKSAHDLFALHFQRARADVIVSTGAILRAEPDLRYDLSASPFALGLSAYRAALGKRQPPRVVVLSRGAGVEPMHPAWGEAGTELWSPQAPVGVKHRPFKGTTLQAIQALRGDGLVVVEAGPSVTARLHAADEVDVLYLTTFSGQVEQGLLAGSAFDEPGLRARLPGCGPGRVVIEPSGRWCFRRFGRG